VIATVPMAGEFDTPTRAEAGPEPEVPEKAEQRRFSAAYKLKFPAEYEGLDRPGKGALLRREGLYSSLINEWRKQRDHLMGSLEVALQALLLLAQLC